MARTVLGMSPADALASRCPRTLGIHFPPAQVILALPLPGHIPPERGTALEKLDILGNEPGVESLHVSHAVSRIIFVCILPLHSLYDSPLVMDLRARLQAPILSELGHPSALTESPPLE